jgi:hypothetical protein
MKWIKLEHKRITIMKVQSKPLKLYPDCKWCQALKELVRWVAHVNLFIRMRTQNNRILNAKMVCQFDNSVMNMFFYRKYYKDGWIHDAYNTAG